MPTVGDITGQSTLIDEVTRLLAHEERPALRIAGPSGSGKTWVAQNITRYWRRRDDVAFVAPGDELLARRARFPLQVAVSSETRPTRSKAVTKVGVEPVAAIPVAGKSLRELLLHVFERHEREAAAQTPYLAQDDREILVRMQRAADRRRPLLVCDNLQWWDDASLELLALVSAAGTRSAFPFLDRLAIVLVETTNAEFEPSSAARSLLDSRQFRSFTLPLCDASSFPALLAAFGGPTELSPEVLDRLYAATGGHLELLRRIADTRADASGLQFWAAANTSEFLFRLLEDRLERHATVPEETAAALRAAAIIGSVVADHEVQCLLRGEPDQLDRVFQPAERLRLVERSGRIRMFAHDLIRRYYADHVKTPRQELHRIFAECLRLLHCGDYARRVEHLVRAGDQRGASEVSALALLRDVRSGLAPNLDAVTFKVDGDLTVFLTAMCGAQGLFDTGRYHDAITALRGIEDIYSEALVAERDILLARCHIKLLTRADRERAREVLSRWDHLRSTEPEIWGRMMVYRVVACVFLGEETEAQRAERTLYEALAKRVQYDSTARVTINHIRLKANMLHSAQVARDRLVKAIEFFSGSDGAASYDPVHQYIGLVNLSANHLFEGEFDQAFATCGRASDTMQSEPSVMFPRQDILATNLTLSAYRSGRVNAAEALDAAQAIAHAYSAHNDAPLLASNVAYYLAAQERYAECVDLLRPLFERLTGDADFDPYYAYFIGNNLSGALYMEQRVAESAAVWRDITPFIADFVGPIAPYMTIRHEVQSQVFSSSRSKANWDTFIRLTSPPRIGPGWAYYGTGFLGAELEFWSDE